MQMDLHRKSFEVMMWQKTNPEKSLNECILNGNLILSLNKIHLTFLKSPNRTTPIS